MHNTSKVSFLLTVFTILLFNSLLNAQRNDSLALSVGSIGSIANKDYQPLWLVSNQWGAFTDQHSDVSSFFHANYTHTFGRPRPAAKDSSRLKPRFFVQAGANLINNNHFQDWFFNEGYARVGFGKLEIRGGRYQQIMGEVDKDLSSGSLATSGNAIPIPMVTIAVADYVPVPFTKGWLQFKGSFSHGWMGNDRYYESWLHEKSFYLQLGKKKLKLFGGVVHDAEWAGKRNGKSLDRSWKGFWNVLTVAEADDGSVGGPITLLPNRPGDQRGILDLGASFETSKFILLAYHQTPFESGQGIDYKNIDNLTGLVWKNKQNRSFLRKVAAEFIYTKQMEKYIQMQYAQTYYNNGLYRTGWEYDNRIVGTPLFVNRHRAANYFPNIKPYDWHNDRIGGNSNILFVRVMGGHIGFLLNLVTNNQIALQSKTLLTYTVSYETRNESPTYKQFYGLQRFEIGWNKLPITLGLGIGLDSGEFTNNFGGQFGVTWRIKGK